MFETVDKRQLVIYIAAAIAIVLIGARYLSQNSATASREQTSTASTLRVSTARNGQITVHVTGEVKHPGVYSLATNSRVDDAIKRAGGRSKSADPQALNLAAKLTDGQQVVMPSRAGTSSSVAGETGQAQLNLNQATAEQLDQLDGIGPTMAAKIIDYRKQNGGFGSVSDLDKIPGIGEKRLASLKQQLEPMR